MLARPLFTRILGALAGLLLIFAGTPGAAQGEYQIRAGDTLQIEVLEDPTLNRAVLVLPDGTISFPFVGSLQTRGRSISQIRTQLTSGLASKFAAPPNVVVSVASLAERLPAGTPAPDPVIDVYIMGEVAEAGKKEVSPGTTILQFLAEAGGLTPFAATARIELHRTDPATGTTRVYQFRYKGRNTGPQISAGTRLAPGDVVVVPSRRLFE